jgi:hypothetical protein
MADAVPTDDDLRRLHAAMLAVASAETSCNPVLYDARRADGQQRSPLEMHCGHAAVMLRGLFGGEIVKGLVGGVRHFWNRLPDGREVDLTSCQFGGDGLRPMKRGRRVSEVVEADRVTLTFAGRVQEHLTKTAERG